MGDCSVVCSVDVPSSVVRRLWWCGGSTPEAAPRGTCAEPQTQTRNRTQTHHAPQRTADFDGIGRFRPSDFDGIGRFRRPEGTGGRRNPL